MTLLPLLLACEPEPPPVVVKPACSSLASSVDDDRIFADIQTLTGGRRSDEERAAARAWIAERIPGTTERPFAIAGLEGVNLVVPGSDVLVGAHYDTAEGTPGADDNASGVAVVLEVARVLAAGAPAGWTPPTYAFFDLEEPRRAMVGRDGRNYAFGSQAFVDQGGDWRAAWIVESVGYGCDDCQQVPSGVRLDDAARDGRGLYFVTNDRSAWMRAASEAGFAGLTRALRPFEVPGRGDWLPQSRFSDHAPFWDAGVRAAVVTDTAPLRNPHYHKESDTADTLDRALLADAARGLVVTLAAVTGRCP
jgi:hypothetical protein